MSHPDCQPYPLEQHDYERDPFSLHSNPERRRHCISSRGEVSDLRVRRLSSHIDGYALRRHYREFREEDVVFEDSIISGDGNSDN